MKEAWITASRAENKREKIQALSLAKDCYSMKLDLLTNATVVDDAITFVAEKQQESFKIKQNGDQRIKQQQDYDNRKITVNDVF